MIFKMFVEGGAGWNTVLASMLIALPGVVGCGGGGVPGSVIRVDVSADDLARVLPRVAIERVIPLADDVPVGEVHKTILWQGRWYVCSKADDAISCFDADGRFLFRIAAEGRGPQEYSGLNNFFVDAGGVRVLTMGGEIVTFSALDGRFVGRQSTPYLMVNDGFAFESGSAGSAGSAFSIMGPEWNFMIRGADGAESFVLPFNGLRDFRISRRLMASDGSQVFLCYGQDDAIYSLDPERDSVRVAWSVDFGAAAIDPRLYSEAGPNGNPDSAPLENRQNAGPFASVLDDLSVTRDHVAFSYWYFASPTAEPLSPSVIFDRRTGAVLNFPRGETYRQNSFWLLPLAATTAGGEFVSVVHPVTILSEGAISIPAVSAALQDNGVAETDNPVIIVWRLDAE